jgi:hypothetical protein
MPISGWLMIGWLWRVTPSVDSSNPSMLKNLPLSCRRFPVAGSKAQPSS